MRLVPSLKRSLPKAGVFMVSSLTLVGTSTLLNLPLVKADETNLGQTSQTPPHTSQSSTPPIEPTAHIISNNSISNLGEKGGSISPQASGKNSYIDTNQYEAPSKVVIIERRSRCQTIIEHGQLIKGECNLASSPSRVKEIAPVNGVRPTRETTVSEVRPRRENIVSEVRPLRQTTVSLQNEPQRFTRRIPPPVEVASISPSMAYREPFLLNTVPLNEAYPQLGLEAVPLEYSRATLAPTSTDGVNRTSLIFPLSIPAAISSAFGWRIHPITGVSKMHTGTDLAAPEGTPVLAAYPGQVETAGWTEGYGLMISLLHEGKTQESRYGHLSEIYVRPGEWVEQGAVIGKVGSTGFSTGPHLHFEWRHLTAEGSIPVDAGIHLQYALNNLIESLQRAQANNNIRG